jgi:hypothetical protein
MHETAVFICSSDNRRDVLERVIPSLSRHWADCPYPVYVGLNSVPQDPGRVTPVLAPVSHWRRELAEQLRQLPQARVILLLDDYLLEAPVDQPRIHSLLAAFEGAGLRYLRLTPLGRSCGERLLRRGGRAAGDFEKIRRGRPYYSSLRIAIWQRDHLLAMLEGAGTVWDFEHESLAGVDHFAITGRPPIRYQHLVEKGRWQPYARRLLRKSGLADDLGSRQAWSGWAYARVWLEEMRFFVCGIANH